MEVAIDPLFPLIDFIVVKCHGSMAVLYIPKNWMILNRPFYFIIVMLGELELYGILMLILDIDSRKSTDEILKFFHIKVGWYLSCKKNRQLWTKLNRCISPRTKILLKSPINKMFSTFTCIPSDYDIHYTAIKELIFKAKIY